MHFQMILAITNHLGSFVQDTRPKDIGSVLNSNGGVLTTFFAFRRVREKSVLTRTMGKAGFRAERHRSSNEEFCERRKIYWDHL